MPSTPSLIHSLQLDYPTLVFVAGDDFHWSPKEKTITYDETRHDASAHLLHELSHAVLEHSDYDRDIELIGLERDAWAHAKTVLGPQYRQSIPAHVIKDSLDTYRDWLHARSTCPTCGANGIEIKKSLYHCIGCGDEWRVNEARLCALRRYRTKK